jgi:7-cyano-7-deazaguanine reductase
MATEPSKDLKIFANPYPDRDYTIEIECPEFTSICPVTGQPDFGTIQIRYVPDQQCIELKSLKLYLWSFRQEGAFHEAVTNTILDDLVAACAPRHMTVVGDFNVRGGISTVVTVEFAQKP